MTDKTKRQLLPVFYAVMIVLVVIFAVAILNWPEKPTYEFTGGQIGWYFDNDPNCWIELGDTELIQFGDANSISWHFDIFKYESDPNYATEITMLYFDVLGIGAISNENRRP